MSPARARTSTREIIGATRALLEAGGFESVTMQAVAERVGVRAPSLYKRFPSRNALIAALAGDAFDELRERLEAPGAEGSPEAGIRAAAETYRRFAHAAPRTYELLFMNLPADARPPLERNAQAAAPVLRLTERLVGPDHGLQAARLLTAFVHGFVSMELNGAFRLGGDLDEAYRYGVDVLIEALTARRSTTTGATQRDARGRSLGRRAVRSA